MENININDVNFNPGMREIVERLLDRGDINVYVPDDCPRGVQSFAILEKDGNTGNVQYTTYPPFGYCVTFSIEPSREHGSGFSIIFDNDEIHTYDIDEAIEACYAVVVPEMENWANNNVVTPNAGFSSVSYGTKLVVS